MEGSSETGAEGGRAAAHSNAGRCSQAPVSGPVRVGLCSERRGDPATKLWHQQQLLPVQLTLRKVRIVSLIQVLYHHCPHEELVFPYHYIVMPRTG